MNIATAITIYVSAGNIEWINNSVPPVCSLSTNNFQFPNSSEVCLQTTRYLLFFQHPRSRESPTAVVRNLRQRGRDHQGSSARTRRCIPVKVQLTWLREQCEPEPGPPFEDFLQLLYPLSVVSLFVGERAEHGVQRLQRFRDVPIAGIRSRHRR